MAKGKEAASGKKAAAGNRGEGAKKERQPARSASASAWQKRLHSKAFGAALRELIEAEIAAVANQKVGDVIDHRRIRALIEEKGPTLIEADVIVELLLHAQDLVADGLRKRNESLLGLVDRKLAASIEAMLDEEPILSEPMEEFVGNLMRQDFVQALFTDIVYTSIVSFNERVNPLFGRFTMGVLEDQIKSFIGLFMPMLQQQATAFATSKENQANFFSFTSAIMKALLDEPLPNFFGMLSDKQRKQAERLIRQAFDDRKLDKLLTENALAVWDGVYAHIRNRKVGQLLLLKENARWLAERIAEGILPVLERPAVLRFVEGEIAALDQSAE